jgi:multiple sugar transport system permease protein
MGIASALLLDSTNLRGRGIFRTLIYIPYTLPIVVVTLLWKWMLSRMNGIINYALWATGILKEMISWLSEYSTVMPCLIFINAWFGYPLIALTVLAGLQTIPREFYELAHLNAASGVQIFRYVIFPSIKRILGIMLVLRTIWIFNAFDMIFLTTAGGPGRATEVLTVYGYRMGWDKYQLGQTAALSVTLLFVLVILISFYFWIFKMEEEV